ncbi:hypothetical protein D3C81_2058470 [compost metagenome]
MSAMMGTTWVTWLSIFAWMAALAAPWAASSSRNRPPSSRASAWRRKVYSSRISALTEVFSCIDWSGSGPNSERSAATIQPDRYR